MRGRVRPFPFSKALQLRGKLGLVAAVAGIGAAAFAAPLAAAELGMLAGLTKGKWEVRIRGEGVRNLCIRSGPEFIQLKHADSGCTRFVVDDKATDVTVQYTCRGNGYGRTHVRKESAKLVQIDSTGIAGGSPFDISAEARHVGAC